MSNHQPPRVPTWEEQTPAERARITRLTREADAQNAQDDLEPSDADKEATTRAVFEQDLRSAYAQWTGNGQRASKTFDQWLRTEATEHPALMNEADAVIRAQDAERAAPPWDLGAEVARRQAAARAAADKRTTPTRVRVLVGASHAYAVCNGETWSADFRLAGGRSAHDDLRKSAAEERAQAQRHLLTAARMEAAAAILEQQGTRS